jgi:iron complex transport system ATP-binding protein
MVLHDLNLAGEYSERLLLMKEGRIHKSGTPDEVLTYHTIEEVYETLVVVGKSPVSSRPYIFVVTEEERKNLI